MLKSSVKASFILITNQDYEQYAKLVVDSIVDACGRQLKYEILVCSPNEITDDRVVWVKDKDGADGDSISVYNQGYKASSGEYIYVLNDDHKITSSALKGIELLESPIFANRRYKVTSIGAGKGCNKWNSTCIPSLLFKPPFPLTEELSNLRFVHKDRYLIMGFPVYHRDTVEKYLNGYLFNPQFKHHYGDNWLPFWLGENGEEPIVCDDTPLYPFGPRLSNTKNDEHDYNVFSSLVKKFLNGDEKAYA